MKNHNLKYYLFGFITGFIAIPVIEEFMSVINSWIQVLVLKPSKIVIKGNKELAELQGDEVEVQSNLIGFQAPSDDYYDDDDDDDDDEDEDYN